jgi:hypothetical protein
MLGYDVLQIDVQVRVPTFRGDIRPLSSRHNKRVP